MKLGIRMLNHAREMDDRGTNKKLSEWNKKKEKSITDKEKIIGDQ